jgi:hypothetical protein
MSRGTEYHKPRAYVSHETKTSTISMACCLSCENVLSDPKTKEVQQMTEPVRRRGRSLFRRDAMAKVMRGAKDFGLEIGGVEVTRDGTIRVLAKDTIKPSSDLDDWLAKGGKDASAP